MVEAQTAPTPLAPLLLRNILLPLFIFSDKTLINLSNKFKVFHIIRYTLFTAFLFFLKVISSFISSSLQPNHNHSQNHKPDSEFDSDFTAYPWVPYLKGGGNCNDPADGRLVDETCIARALTQLLAIINELPVSSRKYEIVRSYAEKLMNENLKEGYEPLRKVTAMVLSSAFSRDLQQLELAAEAAKYHGEVSTGGELTKTGGGGYFGLNRVIKTVGHYGDFAWTQFTKPKTRLRGSAEKLSAELLWLAEKLVACGSADEAVLQWASASKLAFMALSAQQRLQASLVKLSVLLFKEAVSMSMGGQDQDDEAEELRKVKMKLLMSWLPFLCRATIGVEAPVLTLNEKTELENVLGKLIESLKHEEEQEKVLSLWLHHYAHCPSSDWPNLHHYYDRWCTASRKLLILEGKISIGKREKDDSFSE